MPLPATIEICQKARDWSFIVVTDREKLLEMAEANGNRFGMRLPD